jgi:hypothetical protein
MLSFDNEGNPLVQVAKPITNMTMPLKNHTHFRSIRAATIHRKQWNPDTIKAIKSAFSPSANPKMM